MLIVPIEQLKMVFVVRLQCADLVGTTITSHKVAAWARACVCTTRLTPLTRSFVQARHTRTDTCTHTHTRSSRGCKWPQRHAGTPNWFYIRASGTASKSHRSPKLIAVFDDLFKFLCRQILRISTTCETVCVYVCVSELARSLHTDRAIMVTLAQRLPRVQHYGRAMASIGWSNKWEIYINSKWFRFFCEADQR